MMKISAVINTLNEEKNLKRCLGSLGWVDEIVVCDDGSTDRTLEIAKSFKARVYRHKSAGFVEAARNFAVGKVQGDWVLVVDADEEIPKKLAQKLMELANSKNAPSCIAIARKNMIFGRWIQNSGWWPDYQIRFFKKGRVTWSTAIHHQPRVEGELVKLPAEADLAIVHHSYSSIFEFVERLNRYTTIEAEQIVTGGYQFDLRDLVSKPSREFISRFFANRGFLDGVHGLALALLQAVSFLVTYLKVWELQGRKEKEINLSDLNSEAKKILKEFKFWLFQALIFGKTNCLSRFLTKLLYKGFGKLP